MGTMGITATSHVITVYPSNVAENLEQCRHSETWRVKHTRPPRVCSFWLVFLLKTHWNLSSYCPATTVQMRGVDRNVDMLTSVLQFLPFIQVVSSSKLFMDFFALGFTSRATYRLALSYCRRLLGAKCSLGGGPVDTTQGWGKHFHLLCCLKNNKESASAKCMAFVQLPAKSEIAVSELEETWEGWRLTMHRVGLFFG